MKIGIWLHPTLCAGLAAQNFSSPTPIQASTLPTSILGQRDIVGAALTGSRKTLTYALPILHTILSNNDDNNDNHSKNNKHRPVYLFFLFKLYNRCQVESTLT